jgi:mono/diheme cytochrome c family protein
VYTREQAVRGQDVYAGTCKSCHAPASHTGSVFATSWGGKLLSELFLYVSERMPKNDPGSLSWEEYADVTAYLLRLNGQPIGREELPPDSLALRRIRIEVPAGPQRELRER